MLCAIWYHLYNIKNVKNTHGGVLLLVLKVTPLHGCFSCFLNCSNDNKPRKAPHMVNGGMCFIYKGICHWSWPRIIHVFLHTVFRILEPFLEFQMVVVICSWKHRSKSNMKNMTSEARFAHWCHSGKVHALVGIRMNFEFIM